jgi:hypothetical protein
MPERIRLRRPQGHPGLEVPRVELEELTRHAVSDVHDFGGGFEPSPGQLGVGDEPDAGEDRVAGALVQLDEHTEPFDRRNGAGKHITALPRRQERPQLGFGPGGPANATRAAVSITA